MSLAHKADHPASIAIVGVGPRGISVLERLGAALQGADDDGNGLVVHLVDPSQHGAGRIWRTDQTRTLCMNTLSGAVTLFTEPGASVEAPVLQGPTMHEWIELVRGDGEQVPTPHRELFERHPADPSVAGDFADELAVTVPWSNPSRALYGAYLRWCLDVALAEMPSGVMVEHHPAAVVGVRESEGRDELRLDDGTSLEADATVLATGWQVPGPSASELALAAGLEGRDDLVWVRPGNPVDQDLDALQPGQQVLVRGLGMGFFDVMARLTIDRGGRFVADDSARGGLRYEASGDEPKLVVTSRRGYPFLPKSDYGSLPPRAELARTRAIIVGLDLSSLGKASIDFTAELWPAIVRDSLEAYHRTLARVRPYAHRVDVDEVVSAMDDAGLDDVARVADSLLADQADHFDPREWMDPLAGVRADDVATLTARIGELLERDVNEAAAGVDSPLKAGLWVISSARKPTSIVGSEGRFTRESRLSGHAELMAFGSMVGSGPPSFRSRQLLALVDAGLVSFLGGHAELGVDEEGFVASSEHSGSRPVHSTVLVDAWMHAPDVRRAADPLVVELLEQGRARPFCELAADGCEVATNSPEVDPLTGLLVHPDEQLDPRIHLVGIPTSGQLPDTTISPMPGTDSLMLQETDRAARSLLVVVGR